MKLTLLSVVGLIVAATVGAAPTLSIRATPMLPTEDPFYTGPPGWETATPGTILKTRNVTLALLTLVPIPVAGYQLLYSTRDTFDQPIVTVTTVMVPANAAPDKLVAYSVPEDSSSILCAPSFLLQQNAPTPHQSQEASDQAQFAGLLAQGIIVTLSDHDGPLSSFAAGVLEGHAVLDSIRATLAFGPSIGLKNSAKVVMWGYSGGAIATGWAEALLATYAPELNIVGAAHGGTPASLQPCVEIINGGVASGLLVSAATGLATAYPGINASLYSLATPKMLALIEDTKATQCSGNSNANNVDFFSTTEYFTSGNKTLGLPAWQEMFDATMLAKMEAPRIPLHIYHARDDEVIPYAVALELVQAWCTDPHTSLEFVTNTIPQIEHITEALYGVPAALLFLTDRLSGVPFPNGCAYMYDPASVQLAPLTNGSVLAPGHAGLPGGK